VDFRILGPLEVVVAGRGLPLGGAKQRAALAMLLLHRNQVVSRARLIEGLWGQEPPASAGHTLEAYVSRLRRALLTVEASPRLITRAPGYLLAVEAGELDLDRFQAALDRAGTAISGGDPPAAAAALRDALAMFRGAPLEDLTYAPFAQGEIPRLEELRLTAVERRIDADLACGRHQELAGELESLVAVHPLRERFWAQLMLALYRSGRQGEALGAFERARRGLAEELGVDPGPVLTEAQRGILRQDPSLAPAQPRAALPAVAGRHGRDAAARGKAPAADVLAAREAPAPGAFAAAATRGLPRDLAAFTGRHAELARLMGTLADVATDGGVVGICAIDGMAGIGKTTFAVHAAHRLAGSFPDGQFFLPLHAHTPGQRPVGPADALASLLLTAGLAPQQIPPGTETRAAGGAITSRARRSCCCSTTRPGTSRSGRCCPVPPEAWR
jgi:DNA-binding SARP family transcriptional activator